MQFDIHSYQHSYDGCSACDVRTSFRKDVARNRDISHPEISSFGYRTMINQGDCHYGLQFQLALHLKVRNSSNSNPDSHVNRLKHVLV